LDPSNGRDIEEIFRMSRSVRMLVAALLLTSAAVPSAFAQAMETEGPHTRIYIGDIDLYSNAGSAEALARIRGAAAEVCDPNRGPMLTSERETAAQCEFETTLATVDRINHPGLNAQYEGRFPEVIISEGDTDDTTYYPYYDVYPSKK
jgi:UrcA family protein